MKQQRVYDTFCATAQNSVVYRRLIGPTCGVNLLSGVDCIAIKMDMEFRKKVGW